MNEIEIVADVASRLERAWNEADGAAYGEPFTADADFVTIRGELHSGPAIAAGHQAIFDTIYAGSVVRYEPLQARAIGEGVIVGHVKGLLEVPGGPLAGTHAALATLTLVGDADGGHRVAAFHNTLVAA